MSDNDGPTAIKNVLGWSFLGRFRSNNLASNTSKNFKSVEVTKVEKNPKKKSIDSKLNDVIKRSFDIEDWNLLENNLPLSEKFTGGPKPCGTMKNIWVLIEWKSGIKKLPTVNVTCRPYLGKTVVKIN